MSRERHLELKVGSFVLLALMGLTFFIASVSDLSFMEKGYGMQTMFTFANGLRDAAPVRLAGVEAGRVKSMRVFVDDQDGKKTKIQVNIWIKQGILIPVDSKVTINQLGLLGEKYIEIAPGQSTEFLKANSVLLGIDPVPMEKITERVNRLAEKLEVTVDGINNGVLSEKNKESLAVTLADVREIMDNIKQGNGTVGKILSNETIYKNLEELTADLKNNPWKLLYRPKPQH